MTMRSVMKFVVGGKNLGKEQSPTELVSVDSMILHYAMTFLYVARFQSGSA